MTTIPTAIPTAGLGLAAAQPGWVHLVGAGPGDPGLLTLRGAALLGTADLVAYDRLADPRLLDLLSPHAEAIRVGKNPDRACADRTWTQDEITTLVVRAAAEGKAVVRLKGGDPFVFGRGGEEALACRAAGVPFEVVSGVSSAIAGPAAAGIPVTHRGLATGVAFVTGHEDPSKPCSQVDWDALARFHGTLVFLMGVRNAGRIQAMLLAHGRRADTPVAVVQWATTPRERTLHTTLARLADDLESHGLGAPATIVVGDVVAVGALLATNAVTTRDLPDGRATSTPPPTAAVSTSPSPHRATHEVFA
jgi:uroporphyrin-III C-methyltransferase